MKTNRKAYSQTYMFDMTVPERDTNPLVLKEPDAKAWREVESQLMMLNKNDIVEMCQVFHPIIDGHTSVRKRRTDGTEAPASELVALKKYNMAKADVARALAFMLSEAENLRLYVDTLSDEMRELWRLVLIRLYVSLDEVHRVLKTTDRLSNREGTRSYYSYYGDASWNRKEMQLFDLVRHHSSTYSSWGGREDAFFVTLPPAIHRLFFPVFFPDARADHSVAELSKEEFSVVSGERDALRVYPVVSAMLAGGELALASGRYPVRGQKVATKRMNLSDFGIGETDGLRATLYAQLLTLYHVSTQRGSHLTPARTYEAVARGIVQNVSSFYHYLPIFIFAHIKGLTKNVTGENLCCDLAAHDLRLLTAHPQHWVPIRDFYMHSFFGVGNTHHVPFPPLVFNSTEEDYRADIVNTFTDQPLAVDDYTRHFGNTFHKGFLYALAALGLVELACKPAVSGISPYAAIAYARLTQLGKYALGLTDKYESAPSDDRPLFQLDDTRLIVRDLAAATAHSAQESQNPYLEILREISRPIGSNRYEVTAATFLAPCASREDVEQRIQNFRRFVCPQPPAIWQDFFRQLLDRCHPLTLSHEDFHIYTLPDYDRNLQRLVATDPKLRDLVIRAEGLRILVRTIDLSKFRSRFKSLGYLL